MLRPTACVRLGALDAHAWDDCTHWRSADRAMVKRIYRLARRRAAGTDQQDRQPEPLRRVLVGCWSQRISEEHRFVYRVDGHDLVILQVRYHYEWAT